MISYEYVFKILSVQNDKITSIWCIKSIQWNRIELTEHDIKHNLFTGATHDQIQILQAVELTFDIRTLLQMYDL